jgi:hypothetical protein
MFVKLWFFLCIWFFRFLMNAVCRDAANGWLEGPPEGIGMLSQLARRNDEIVTPAGGLAPDLENERPPPSDNEG